MSRFDDRYPPLPEPDWPERPSRAEAERDMAGRSPEPDPLVAAKTDVIVFDVLAEGIGLAEHARDENRVRCQAHAEQARARGRVLLAEREEVRRAA